MAYSRSRSRRSVRGGNRRGRSASRSVRGRSRVRARSGSRRSGGQQTLRIVMEHPAANPMISLPTPLGQRRDTSVPMRARF